MTDSDAIMQTTKEIPYARTQAISLMVLAAVALTFSIYWLRPVLVPLVVALFVVSGVSPILRMLEKRLGVSRVIAAVLTFLAGVVMLIVFGISIWVSMLDLKKNAPAYGDRVVEIVDWGEVRIRVLADRIEQLTSAFLPKIDESEGDEETERDNTAESDAASIEVGHAKDVVESGVVHSNPSASQQSEASDFVEAIVRDGIGVISQTLFNLVSTSIVVLIYVFFLLLGTSSGGHHKSNTVREIDLQIRSYLSLKTVISIFTGIAFGFSLRLFGVPMAFTFGVLAFLLNFVPNIGPIVSSLLPIPLIVLDPDGSLFWMASAISVSIAIQLISGNLVEPKIMGNSSDLHPVTILVALMFWGMMWGVIGMFLATPITAAIKILLHRIDTTRPIANLMAGRWQEGVESHS